MSYTMYTPLNVWLDPASMTDVVAYIQTYLQDNPIYSTTEIETLIHDYLIAHPELIGGVQSVNGKTGTVVLSASDINTENNVTIESVLASLSSQISSIAASVATNTANITSLTGRMTTAETDLSNLKSKIESDMEIASISANELEMGIINSSTGAKGSSGNRCCTPAYIPSECTSMMMQIPSGYRASAVFYSDDNESSFLFGTGLKDADYSFNVPENARYYRVSLAFSDNHAFNSSSFNALANNIKFKEYGVLAPLKKITDQISGFTSYYSKPYIDFKKGTLPSYRQFKRHRDANIVIVTNGNLLPPNCNFYNNNDTAFNGYNVSADTVRVRTESFAIPSEAKFVCVSGYDKSTYTISGVRCYDNEKHLIQSGGVVFPHDQYDLVSLADNVTYINLIFAPVDGVSIIHPSDVELEQIMINLGADPIEYLAPQRTQVSNGDAKFNTALSSVAIDLYDHNVVFTQNGTIQFVYKLLDESSNYETTLKFIKSYRLSNNLVFDYFNATNVVSKFSIDTSTENMLNEIDILAQNDPNYIKKTNSGLTDESGTYSLNFYELNARSCGIADKPKIIIVSNQHGYEKTAAFTSYWLMDALSNHYTENSILRYIHDNVALIILPLVNPWGFDQYRTAQAGTESGYTNYNNVNINRNYTALDQKETQFVAGAIAKTFNAMLGIDLHANGTTRSSDNYEYTNWHSLHSNGNIDIVEVSRLFLNMVSREISDELNIQDTRIGYISGNNNESTLLSYFCNLSISNLTFELPMKLPSENGEFSVQCQKISLELLVNYLAYIIQFFINRTIN